jgi:hypothetical protein
MICIVVFGPLLTILTLIPHAKKKTILLPFSFSPAIYATVFFSTVFTVIAGFCTATATNLKIDTFQCLKIDTLQSFTCDMFNRFDLGPAAATKIIMLLLLLTFYAVLFGMIFLIMFISSKFVTEVPKEDNKHKSKYIPYVVTLLLSASALAVFIYILVNGINPLIRSYSHLAPLSKKIFNMLLYPAIPSFLAAVVVALATIGFVKTNSVIAKIIICITVGILPTSFLTIFFELTSIWLMHSPVAQAILCVFSSASFPLAFLYLSVAATKAQRISQNPINAVLKNIVPVLCLSYISCFISADAPSRNYDFSIYYTRLFPAQYYRPLVLILVVFIALSFLFVALLFPKRKKTSVGNETVLDKVFEYIS